MILNIVRMKLFAYEKRKLPKINPVLNQELVDYFLVRQKEIWVKKTLKFSKIIV
jgi:hypothetical protein